MKHTILLATLLLGICCWSLPQVALADDAPTEETSTAKKKKKAKKARSVAQSFKEISFFNAPADDAAAAEADDEPAEVSPDKRAKYYIYLHSASWCGPCKALMPKVIADYKQMRKKKVEVILISYDQTVEAAQNYLKGYNAEFCGVLSTAPDAQNLPSFRKADSIPYAMIVDKKGKVVTAGNGASIIENWKLSCK